MNIVAQHQEENKPVFSFLNEKARVRASLVKKNRSGDRVQRRSTVNGSLNDFLSEHTRVWDHLADSSLTDESSYCSQNSVATTGNRYPRRSSVQKFSLDNMLDSHSSGDHHHHQYQSNHENLFDSSFTLQEQESSSPVVTSTNPVQEIFTIDQLPIPMKKKKNNSNSTSTPTKNKKKKKSEKDKKDSTTTSTTSTTSPSCTNKTTKDISPKKKKDGDKSRSKKKKHSSTTSSSNSRSITVSPKQTSEEATEGETSSRPPPSPGVLGRRNSVTKYSLDETGEIALEETSSRIHNHHPPLRQGRRGSVTKYSVELKAAVA